MDECVFCGDEVAGFYDAVKLTLFCKFCCGHLSKRYGMKRCSATRALSVYGCRQKDLQKIQKALATQDSQWTGNNVRSYLFAEVKYLGDQAKEEKHHRDILKRKRAEENLSLKRQRLATLHHVHITNIQPLLRPFILGDYYQAVRPKTRLKAVRHSYNLREKACNIMQRCQAHPLTALEYVKMYTEGNVDHFCQFRENVRTVFRLEGSRILSFLDKGDLVGLKDTPLSDVLEDVQSVEYRRKVLNLLIVRLDVETARELLSTTTFTENFCYGVKEEETSARLLKYWEKKQHALKREEELRLALYAKEIDFDEQFPYFKDYIDGVLKSDLNQIIEIIDSNRRIFTLSYVAWKEYSRNCKAEYLRCLSDQEVDFDTSFERTLGRSSDRFLNYVAAPYF